MQMVLIHGLWLDATSWEHVAGFFRERGWEVETPEWPEPRAGLGLAELVDHHARIVRDRPEPPVLVGHSFGGLVVQILLDRGLGRAGVALDPAPPRGVWQLPLSVLKAASPALLHPATRKGIVRLSFEEFRYGFVNTWPEDEARDAYERYHVPDTGRVLWQNAVKNMVPSSPAAIDFARADRAPLLISAGGEDHTVPPVLSKANYGKYARSSAVTDYVEFPGRSHLLVAGDGWQQVAGTIEEWLAKQGITATPTAEPVA
jgi:pimeloyl-ACP methyl ester carboxylesterase